MTVILLAALVAAYGLYSYLLFPLFLSPLARLPTPHWSCALSSFWILRARKRGTENRSLHDAHSRNGPIVRVAPDTLSVDSIDAVRTIYQGGFEKWPWYAMFHFYGVPCIFSSLGSKEHSRRKRIVSRVYSKSFIHSSQALKAQSRAVLQGRLLPLLQREAVRSECEGTEVMSILLATTMDLLSAYIFGIQGSTNFLDDQSYRHHWLRMYLNRHHHSFWPQELPTLTKLCSKLGVRLYPSFVDKEYAELQDWNLQLCNRARDFLVRGETSEENEPVVFRALYAGIKKEEESEGSRSIQKRDLAVASEIMDQLLAGHETAGITLTYLTWRMSQNPALQDQLRAELLSLKPTTEAVSGNLPDGKALDALPLLQAVIMETLRLHSPIPAPQPRITPYPFTRIDGFDVPGGVRVAALAYTLHLNETVFPDPRRWDHTRWLPDETSDEAQKDMKRQFWAFGSGGRMCIGSNFALSEMKQIVALIYSNFRTSIVDDSGMEQTDAYSARPKGDRLMLKLTCLDP
ncbi:hypothetical protein XA68_15514 [Ophiocordyceps unilateralis]|uniref:Cytochrome P450 n=1 Tax=Ophiocordyceps unilateralis TaxID=268505 RepID=A0A2A9P8D3_OPHUN|nr:hypothetical protein XA68_15514 [Ophiocordyceps unilateralis]